MRVVVLLPDGHRVIARVAESPGLLERVALGHIRISEHSVVPRGKPGQQCAARRRAGGSRRVSAAEADAFLRQAIEVRCVDDAVPGGAQTVPALLVRHQEEDVRPRPRPGARRLRRRPPCRRGRAAHLEQGSSGHGIDSPDSKGYPLRRMGRTMIPPCDPGTVRKLEDPLMDAVHRELFARAVAGRAALANHRRIRECMRSGRHIVVATLAGSRNRRRRRRYSHRDWPPAPWPRRSPPGRLPAGGRCCSRADRPGTGLPGNWWNPARTGWSRFSPRWML